MRATRYSLIAVFGIVLLLPSKEVVTAPAPPQSPPTYQQFLSPASPLEVVAAKKVDRIAWVDLRGRQAQRLHGRRAGIHASAADELH